MGFYTVVLTAKPQGRKLEVWSVRAGFRLHYGTLPSFPELLTDALAGVRGEAERIRSGAQEVSNA